MRISYWSSDVCSSGLKGHLRAWRKFARRGEPLVERFEGPGAALALQCVGKCESGFARSDFLTHDGVKIGTDAIGAALIDRVRSEEHTSELQSLMRISYAVFCLKKKNEKITTHKQTKPN